MELSIRRSVWLALVWLAAACAPAFGQTQIPESAARQMRALIAEKTTRNPAQMKLDSQIHYAAKVQRGQPLADGVATLPALSSTLETRAGGLVHVDIKANVNVALLAAVAGLGGTVESSFERYGAIRAWIPLQAAETLAGRPDVLFIRPAARARVNTGPDTNGVLAHAADVVQGEGYTGAGVKIGVLSSGVDSLASQQAAGNLPPTVQVISGQAGTGDEGTAMLEIVYSMAPGAQLFFATGNGGEAQMAANIEALAAAGCHIIVDDISYSDEPAFQDGTISQAVNTVTGSGALYFSSAANSGNEDSGTSGTWEGDFVNSGASIGAIPESGTLNSFGGFSYDTITQTSSEPTSDYGIQWSDAWGASCNDYDLFILDSTLSIVLGSSTNVQTCSQDPYESIMSNATSIPAGSQLVIVNYQGNAAPRAIHVDTERGQLGINTQGATFGHNAAAAAITVAATDVANARGAAFTGFFEDPPETFSSDGPRTIFYNPNGTPITPGNYLLSTNGGTVLPKVDITAADGIITGVTGYNPFFGTSAAAPHAASIAALALSANPSLTAAQIKSAMLSTALPVSGYNARTIGSGITMANRIIGGTGGTIQVNATLNAFTWTGSVSYQLTGPHNLTGTAVPATYSSLPAGSYTLAYRSGGPAGATLASITPSTTQTLNVGATITFTLNFTTPSGPQLATAFMSKSTPTGTGCNAPPVASGFLTTDNQALVYFLINNANTGDQATANWYTPTGSLYTTFTWNPVLSPGNYCFWDSIAIAGNPPASQPGAWNVAISYNGAPLFTLYFTIEPSGVGLQFVPVPPCRVVDTRNAPGPFGGPNLYGNSRDFPLPNGACGIPATALAYSLNVTVVPSGPLGYLTIWPTGQPQPVVSTLNSQHGIIKADAAIVPAGTNGSVSVYASAATGVVLDINGYFVAGTGLAFYPLAPCRVVDTRNALGSLGGPIMNAAQTRSFPLPSGGCGIPGNAQAYSLNFTVVPSGPLGYLTTWPDGGAQPVVSTLNASTGLTTANAAIVPAGTSGAIDVYTSAKTQVVIDINGYFAPVASGGLSFYPVSPCRAVDTRNATGPLGGPPFSGQRDFPLSTSSCGLPANAQAYSLNATVVPQVTLGYLTLWPTGAPKPVVSTLNSPDGSIDSNAAIVPTLDGSISAYASAATALILDANGYFAP